MGRIIRKSCRIVPLLLVLGLAACGSSGPVTGPNLGASARYPGLSCAPFARELSGIALYGDAATWWDQAAGRYGRSRRPEVGSALVFERSERLPSGHVSVVSKLLTPRQVLVMQANWVSGELDQDQLVVDVSEHNDWSAVRVWYPPVNQLGSYPYPTYGFVLPPQPATHAELVRAVAPAARLGMVTVGRAPPRARLVGG
jgi:surface antigen